MGSFISCLRDNSCNSQYSALNEASSQISSDVSDVPPPLKNIGANCYLNSVLQALSSSSEFVHDIVQLHKNYESLEKLKFFTDLIQNIHIGNKNLKDISKNEIFKNWKKSGQQDSFELLAYVLNQVYNEIRNHKEILNEIEKRNMAKWLNELLPMRIILAYTLRCDCGKVVDVPLHSELALHVPIIFDKKQPFELQYLLDEFFADNEITNYDCYSNTCYQKKVVRETKLVKPLPNTICLHLQRTFWNGKKMKKINNVVNFNEKLIIKSAFCKFGETENLDLFVKNYVESIIETSVRSIQNDCSVNDVEYRLTSFIVHQGSVRGGHYICYKSMKNNWFLANDSQVKRVEFQKLSKCQAYLLFYEKVRKDDKL